MRSVDEIKKDFLDDLDKWQNIVRYYRFEELLRQPESDQWSIGQVIDHFVIETNWYFEQAAKALVDTRNLQKSKSTPITKWFMINSFPDERFKGPDDLEEPARPKSIDELIDKLNRLQKDVLEMAGIVSKNPSKGKAELFGHRFLTAQEWFQYAEMHCRHHFRQQKRIIATTKKINK